MSIVAHTTRAVKNQCNGRMEWNTGMKYWNGYQKLSCYFITTWISDEDYQQGYEGGKM